MDELFATIASASGGETRVKFTGWVLIAYCCPDMPTITDPVNEYCVCVGPTITPVIVNDPPCPEASEPISHLLFVPVATAILLVEKTNAGAYFMTIAASAIVWAPPFT